MAGRKLILFFKSKAGRYLLYGVLLGALFSFTGIFLEQYSYDNSLNFLDFPRMFHEDHSVLIYLIATSPFVLGALTYFVGLEKDRSDKINKELENRVIERTQQLEKEKSYFKALVEANPVSVVTLNMDNEVVSVNQSFVDLFGYTREEIAGVNIDYFLAPGKLHEEARSYTNQVYSGQSIWQEGKRLAKNGDLIDVDIRGVPIVVSGKQIGTLALYDDIHLRKQTEWELKRAKITAEDAARTKADFLSNMSHEIRTPLNAIVGMTGLLAQTEMNDEQMDYVNTIQTGSDTLLSIINDILDFSKIEAGKLELEVNPFYLRDCIENTLDLLVPKATTKKIDLAYQIDDQVPPVILGDITRLQQIMVNLVGNAIKFTEKGEIVVSVSLDEMKKNEATLQFSVRDTGIGIPQDRMDRLFKSFSQIDSSTTRKYGGTGLGLSISKMLTNLMGGNIWVESEVNVGSTFFFTIQCKIDPEAKPKAFNTSHDQFAGKRVLIVDDIATNRTILTKQTTSWGMEPVAVSSGKEALAVLQSGEKFDMAILDMQMPEMDGFMLAKEIRKKIAEADLPLIMLTSMGRVQGREGDVKFSAFMSKPIKPSTLFETIYGVLVEQPISKRTESKSAVFETDLAERHPLHILLAEDNKVNQKVALGIFKKLGYTIDIVDNGLEVIRALNKKMYDVIFMDIQMPEMDGVEATHQIQDRWGAGNYPPIIAMTAHALEGDREKYLALGMDGYISKPINIRSLIETIEQIRPQTETKE